MSLWIKALIFGVFSLVCYIITGLSHSDYKEKHKNHNSDISTYFAYAKYLFLIFAYAGLAVSLFGMIFNM